MSYRSALVKCRPIIDTNGCRMGEQISKMTVEDVKEAVKEDEARRKNAVNMSTGFHSQSDNIATNALKAVSTSCRAFGTSKEAA